MLCCNMRFRLAKMLARWTPLSVNEPKSWPSAATSSASGKKKKRSRKVGKAKVAK